MKNGTRPIRRRRERRSVTNTVLYFFDGNQHIREAISALSLKADEFEGCTNAWYTENAATGSSKRVNEICPVERNALEQALESFTLAVAAARHTAEQVN